MRSGSHGKDLLRAEGRLEGLLTSAKVPLDTAAEYLEDNTFRGCARIPGRLEANQGRLKEFAGAFRLTRDRVVDASQQRRKERVCRKILS
ncbi:hypothetical protein D3C74_464570 [compost metagenome]